jgi:hypothetical protein
MKQLRIFAFLILNAYAASVFSEHRADLSVEVQGILLVGEFFGPPNYGENPESDRIEKSYVLQLPAPLSTQLFSQTDSELSSSTAYYVQLMVSDAKQVDVAKLVGNRVKVIGPLDGAETGHHRTPVLLQVNSISKLDKWQW